jgi:TRAP-type transport system periplasmic protein
MFAHLRDKSRLALVAAAVLGITTSVTACGSSDSSDSAGGTTEWDFVGFLPASHEISQEQQAFADEVEKATDGRLKINMHWAGELPYDPADYLEEVGSGSVDMADIGSSYVAGSFPSSVIPNLPFFAPTTDDYAKLMDSPFGDSIRDQFAEHGASVAYWYSYPAVKLFGKGDPVKTGSDLDGRIIRTGGDESFAEFLKNLGASPVSITAAEVPTALQTGTVDGVATSALNAESSGLGEYLDWGYTVDIGKVISFMAVNEDSLNALPDDVRKEFEDVAAEQLTPEAIARPNQQEEDALNSLEKEGVELNAPTDEDLASYEAMMTPYWDEWATKEGDQTVADLKLAKEALGKS